MKLESEAIYILFSALDIHVLAFYRPSVKTHDKIFQKKSPICIKQFHYSRHRQHTLSRVIKYTYRSAEFGVRRMLCSTVSCVLGVLLHYNNKQTTSWLTLSTFVKPQITQSFRNANISNCTARRNFFSSALSGKSHSHTSGQETIFQFLYITLSQKKKKSFVRLSHHR